MDEMTLAKQTPLPENTDFDMEDVNSEGSNWTEVGAKRNQRSQGGPNPVRTRLDKEDKLSLTTQNRYEILKDFTPCGKP